MKKAITLSLLQLILLIGIGNEFCNAGEHFVFRTNQFMNRELVENIGDTIIGAPVPSEIENPELLGINKEPAHATLMPYRDVNEALSAIRHSSSFCRNLNGNWKFNWVAWPQQRPVDFYKTTFDVSSWKEITVPSNWQVVGYGTPYYRNIGYTFQVDFPKVMSEPPKEYTSYKERNPVGSYRRDFDLPSDWNGRRIFLTFDGVDAGFFLWINGVKVGYSVNSRNAAEFDVTNLVKPGKNMVAVEVYRYTSGSYMEDQDMWRLSGIFRNVTIWSAPQLHLRDFFVKTDLDNNYKNGSIEVLTKIKNYNNKPSKAQKLEATLYDGSKVITKSATMDVPALKSGEETSVKIVFPVDNPKQWTAETPNLYTTVIALKNGNVVSEIISSRTGFRKIEIKGRSFLVNGVPIKLKGVNRHEHWPEVGHAITEAQMIRDLEVIKQGNCNHVRTCHYSDDPRWYELCDEYGIYLVAEANVECHGLDRKFVEDPRMKPAIVDRNVTNVENFKNHPSVIIWSEGNENGERNINFKAALAAIKLIDTTRPVHYEPFGIGSENPADIDSRMYTGPEGVEKIALDNSKYTKPFYLCEYAHAMFNSMGSICDYNDLFDKYPTLLGGAVWEYQDQGLWNRRDPKHPILAFGGGFGEFPNDHYFIHKGVVASDRSPKPHYPEMKHAYQWIGISEQDLTKGEIKIRNRYQFKNLNEFAANWTLWEDGIEISHGELSLPDIAPGEEKPVTVPYHIDKVNGIDYYLRISFVLSKEEVWAKKGYEIASQQLKVPVTSQPTPTSSVKMTSLVLDQNDQLITVKGTGFGLTFDKTIGTFSKIEREGVNLLAEGGGPRLHLWRAPHRKDDMWADKRWIEVGLKDLKWSVAEIHTEHISSEIVNIAVTLNAEGKNNFKVTHQVVYSILGDGTIRIANTFSSSDPKLIIARMGILMLLAPQFDQLRYFGRGPMENYSDRKRGSDIGLYSSLVTEQMTPYEKPMECGNHEDVKWAKVTNGLGKGILVKNDTSMMQISSLPYSDEEMENVEYRIDLPKSNKTVLCVSHLTLGVGSNGCGPRPLAPYMVYAEPVKFNYELQLLAGKEKTN